MRSIRLAATGIATVTVVLLAQAGSSSLAAASWESRQVEVVRAGDSLLGVSCPTAGLCVAVGNRGAIVTSENPDGDAGAWRSETATPGAHVGEAVGEPDRTSPGSFESVSCPTTGMCAAVSYAGDFYASGNPRGGAATWAATDLDGDGSDTHFKGISCPTMRLCVAVSAGGSGAVNANGGGKIVAIRNPLSDPIAPLQVQLDQSLDLQAVSCPIPSFCIAVASKGRVVVSADPGSQAPTWREIGTPGGPGDLEAVHCPGGSLCLAGNARGSVLSSTDADSAAPRWREVNTGPSVPITGISCPTAARCAAVDNNGDVAVSSDPTGPAGSWLVTSLLPFAPKDEDGRPFNALFGVACPSAGFCAAAGSRGVIFTSRDPFEVEDKGGKGRRGPKRPRMKILHSDQFPRQSHTKGAGSRVTFRLRPFGRVRGFLCSLDGRRFRRCRSPLRIYATVGSHVLRARAIGHTGLRGPVARNRFAIRRD